MVNVTLPKRSSYAIGLKRLYLLFYLFDCSYHNHLPCPFRLICDLTVGSFDIWSSFFVLIQLWNQKKWFLWFLLFGRISKWYFRAYIFANHTLILWQSDLKNSLKIKYQATFFFQAFEKSDHHVAILDRTFSWKVVIHQFLCVSAYNHVAHSRVWWAQILVVQNWSTLTLILWLRNQKLREDIISFKKYRISFLPPLLCFCNSFFLLFQLFPHTLSISKIQFLFCLQA